MMVIKKIVLLVCVQCLCLVALLHAETPLKQGSLLAAYLSLTSPEQAEERFRLAHQYGCNAALIADGRYQLQTEWWQAWGQIAGKYDIQMMPVLNFAVPRELRETPGSYRPYVTRDGEVYQKTPCPADETYWNVVIGERFARLAELATTTAITGVAFDTEMYGSDISLYTDLCYCDACWQEFMNAEPSFDPNAASLGKEARFDYLITHQLLQRYTMVQWERVRTILSQIEQRVHRIHPHLQLGFLCYLHNWFYMALVQGLGTPENPVLVFSESSYVLGYTPYVDQERDKVLGNQQIVRYIPGLWLSRFFPHDLPAQLTDLATHTDGYWIYTADSIWTDDPKSKGESVHGSSQEYWSAIKKANDELLRLASDSDLTARTIPAVNQASFYDAAQRRLSRASALRQLFALLGAQASGLPSGSADMRSALPAGKMPALPIYRGQTLVHCLRPTGGSVQITHVPVARNTDPELFKLPGDGTSPIEYIVFDDEGQVVQEGNVKPPESSKTIELPANREGVASLLITSGLNGVQMKTSGFTGVVEASSTFPLEIFFDSPPLEEGVTWGLYVPTGQQWLKFQAHCPPPESAVLSIQSPETALSPRTRISGFTEFQIDLDSASDSKFWTITTAPDAPAPFGDVRLYLYDAEFPYVWVMP
jgi:hypothetical protein